MKTFLSKINLITLLVLSTVVTSFAQNYSQTGTSATFYNTGVFTFVNSGTFSSDDDGRMDNSGTITLNGATNVFTDEAFVATNGWGSSSTYRIGGMVTYSATTTQDVQGRYFTDLNMEDSGQKDFPGHVYVGGDYTASGGTRDYNANTGIFNYDASSGAQTIFGDSDKYNILYFSNPGTKTLDNGEIATATGEIVVQASTVGGGVTIKGSLLGETAFTQETAAGTFFVDGTDGDASASFTSVSIDAIVELNNNTNDAKFHVGTSGGSIATNGVVTVTSGTFYAVDGSLTLAAGSSNSFTLASANSAIVVGNSRTFTINEGGFTNDVAIGARTNMAFDDASTVNYNDGGDVVITDTGNPYGNLGISGTTSIGVETDGNEIFLSGNLDVSDKSFDLTYSSGSFSNTLTMQDEDATVAYGSEIEVVGMMKRLVSSGSKTFTMNNPETTVDFTTIGGVTAIALDVRPGGGTDAATTGFSDYDTDTDMDRSINFYYESSATFLANVSYAYLDGSGTGDETNGLSSTITDKLRFREDDGTGNSGKVATGNPISRTDASPYNSVYLTGIRGSGDNSASSGELATVENGGLLFLRGGPTIFISVANGRWANPATWDEGEQPSEEDIAAIRHNVWVGYTKSNGVGDNFAGSEDVGVTGSASDGLIAGIIIDDDFDGLTKTDGATLYIGSDAKIITNDAVAAIYPDYNGSVVNNEAQTQPLLAPTFSLANSAGHIADAGSKTNSGFVVFGGATFVIEGSFQNNNSGIYNAGEVTVGK